MRRKKEPYRAARERRLREQMDPNDLRSVWITDRLIRGAGRSPRLFTISNVLVAMALEGGCDDTQLRRIMRMVDDFERREFASVIGRALTGDLDLSVFDPILEEPLIIEREFDARAAAEAANAD